MREHAWAAAANLLVAVAIAATILELLPEESAPASSPVVFVEAAARTPPAPSALPAAGDAAAAEVRLTFAGDIMQHASQAQDSFDASYERIAPLLHQSDIVVGNLEFPVVASRPAGPDDASVQFNGSPSHLDALARAGFTLVSTSNNHAFDQGVDGLRATLQELQKRGLAYVGSAATRDELEQALIMQEVRGVRIAFFAYTGFLNTYLRNEFDFDDPPADLPLFFANFAEWDDEYRERGRAMFRRHVERARAAGADFVIALTHWGEEWHFDATDDQRAAARDLLDAGFDLVVGGHGHVLNTPEIAGGKLVVYSLGNLLCDFAQWQARTGALLDVVIRKEPGGATRVADFAFHPLYIRREGHVIEPLDSSAGAETGERQLSWSLASKLLGAGIAPGIATATR